MVLLVHAVRKNENWERSSRIEENKPGKNEKRQPSTGSRTGSRGHFSFILTRSVLTSSWVGLLTTRAKGAGGPKKPPRHT